MVIQKLVGGGTTKRENSSGPGPRGERSRWEGAEKDRSERREEAQKGPSGQGRRVRSPGSGENQSAWD